MLCYREDLDARRAIKAILRSVRSLYLDRSQNQPLQLMHKAPRDSSNHLCIDFYHSVIHSYTTLISHHSMGFQTTKIVRKRRLYSGKAKRQQQDRRKECLFKKAYEYSLECDADVYISIRIEQNGRVFTFNSDSTREWQLSEAQIVCRSRSGRFSFRNAKIKQDNCYPLPVRTTLEDFKAF